MDTHKVKIELMTHVIAGYRSLAESEALIMLMAEKGVNYIEIQIPFSDPIGDGSTITMANQYALDSGMTVEKSLQFIEKMCKNIKDTHALPILIMTYANVVFRYGYKEFFQHAKDIGVQGCIIPDLPFLARDSETLKAFEQASALGLPIVPVISPNTTSMRMREISDRMQAQHNQFMVYCTQRTGVTGTHEQHTQSTSYLDTAREIFMSSEHTKLAGGFGISSVEKVQSLIGVLDVAVIGSHIMNLYKATPIITSDEAHANNLGQGLGRVRDFLDEINTIRKA